MSYNLDLTRIKRLLRKKESETGKDTELQASLDEAFNDFNNWLKGQGVNPDNLPFPGTDPDIELIKDIEARGGAGFYTEDAWMQTFQDKDRMESDSQPTNTHLALYYRKRKEFYDARFKVGPTSDLAFKRGGTVDECPPDQDACTGWP